MLLKTQAISLYLLISLCSALLCVDLEWGSSDDRNAFALVPEPTASPQELFKSDSPGPLCGYITDDQSNSLTCASTNYCGFQATLSIFGCCTATVGQDSLAGCDFQTSCFDSTQISTDCLGECQSNTGNLLCTESTARNCIIFSYTDGSIPYEGFGCSTAYEVIEFGSTYTNSSPATTTADGGFAATGSGVLNTHTTTTSEVGTSTTLPSTSNHGSSSVVPISFSQTQHSANGQGTTVTVVAPSATTSDAKGLVERLLIWKLQSIAIGMMILIF